MSHAVAQPKPQLSREKQRLLEIIKEKSLLKGGPFKLASGAVSNYYLDMKPTALDGEGAYLIAEIVVDLLAKDGARIIGGLELGAVPIIAAACARSWPDHPVSGFVVRKEKKGHGTDKRIDGNFRQGARVVLIDDVTTSGGSVLQAAEAVRAQGGEVEQVITIVDRLQGAAENLAKERLRLTPIFTKNDLLSD